MNIALLLNNTYDHLLQNGDLIVLREDIDISKSGLVKDGKIIYKNNKYSIQSYIAFRMEMYLCGKPSRNFRIRRNGVWMFVDNNGSLAICKRYYPFQSYFKHGDILIVRVQDNEFRLLYNCYTESFCFNGKLCSSMTNLINEFKNYSHNVKLSDMKVKRQASVINMNDFVPCS
jgi:hypothetical protein